MANLPRAVFSASLALAVGASALHADWMLIDDFESYEPGQYDYLGEPASPYPISTRGAYPVMSVVERPGESKSAYLTYESIDGSGMTFHQMALPEEVALDEIATVSFRILHSGPETHWQVLLWSSPADVVTSNVSRTSEALAALRFRQNALEALDGETYRAVSSGLNPDPEKWYTYWVVIQNMADGDASTGEYRIYRRAEGAADAELLTWQVNESETSRLMTRPLEPDSIRTLVFHDNSGWGGQDYWLVDDIYFTKGESVTAPIETGDWCGGPLDEGYADTGDWLGWVYAADAPWIYSEDAARWFYSPDCPDDNGGWVYVTR